MVDVLIRPMNRRIDAPLGANLLDLLRSHGVPVSHSCASGRCGLCRCKVLSGDVHDGSGVETRSRAADIPGRFVIACQSAVTEPCVIEVPEADEIVVHPARKLKATVTAFEALTHDVRLLRLGLSKPLAYSPGQYLDVAFAPGVARPYSPATPPGEGALDFHIRILPGGRVTQWLERHMAVGRAVTVSGPLGNAYLRRGHAGPMLCLAAGTGLAPMLSVARAALEGGMTAPLRFLLGVVSERDLYGEEGLADLARRYANFRYDIVVGAGSAGGRGASRRSGLLTDAMLEDVPRLEGWRVYMAGPSVVVEAATVLALRRGARPEHVHAEAFHATGI